MAAPANNGWTWSDEYSDWYRGELQPNGTLKAGCMCRDSNEADGYYFRRLEVYFRGGREVGYSC